MKLEVGNFYVRKIQFGDKTNYHDGLLTINKEEALALVKEDEHITAADLVLANPGDEVRIVPVKEAIEPRCKVSGGTIFPGVIGELKPAGEGRTHALKGSCVLAVGRWGCYQDGLIDMSGPGAPYSYFSQLQNICLVADTDEEFERHESHKRNRALRWAGMRLAEYIGKCVLEMEPEKIETYELAPMMKRSQETNRLPGVVYVMQLDSQMNAPGFNSLIYGWDVNHTLPTYMHPNEILDGAVIAGSFSPASSIFSTYDLVNNPTILKLYQEHGKTINFLGVIASNNNPVLEEKIRSSIFVGNIAKSLGADAAIVAEQSYGNPDADFIQCIAYLEDLGIKTVGMTNECTGRDGKSQPLVTLDEKADAIVSTGNVSELLELPPMKTVIGDLAALGRDGISGGWADDELLGPSVRADGSIIMENNGMFCGDATCGFSTKTVKEF